MGNKGYNYTNEILDRMHDNISGTKEQFEI